MVDFLPSANIMVGHAVDGIFMAGGLVDLLQGQKKNRITNHSPRKADHETKNNNLS
jgi:hypothetical protein